jgi:hypothetical protein
LQLRRSWSWFRQHLFEINICASHVGATPAAALYRNRALLAKKYGLSLIGRRQLALISVAIGLARPQPMPPPAPARKQKPAARLATVASTELSLEKKVCAMWQNRGCLANGRENIVAINVTGYVFCGAVRTFWRIF